MIFDKLFQLMAEKKASDIFVSAGAPIHIKIQGSTIPINQQIIDPATIKTMAYEMLKPEQIRHFEEEKEINISFGIRDVGNFRVNMFWQRGSIAIVVRFIQGEIPSLDELGLPNVLAEVIMEKRGLVLVVGSTGSGKSTTLAAMIDHRNANRSGHILTVEDPIEYLFKHKKSVVNQREIGLDTKFWENALKNATRAPPDAQTGHLCLATLHANNSYHALNRIINFYAVENRPALYLDLSVSLKCIISQRLVKRPDGKRIPAIEILLNTRHIQELIERGEVNGIKEAMEQSLAPGSQTFEQDLFRLYKENTITLDEALANADSPTNLSWLINNSQLGAPSPGEKRSSAPAPALDFSQTDPGGASFSEFTLHVDDAG
ncbi:MAG: type IV pili twitching motility protein PilT [Rhodocyclaceae bacterium UTPRO2]|nr:MAG: type IV pili twitching motility protein PilT [Rhodocyclaceae bacterium UTPRO2]